MRAHVGHKDGLKLAIKLGNPAGVDKVNKENLTLVNKHGAGQDPVKRAQIIAGAQAVFFNKGFEAASMSDIAREAGVSKGTLYVYFADKDALFSAICDEYRLRLFAELIAVLENGTYDKEQLVAFGLLVARRFLAEPAISAQRIVLGIRDRNPDVTRGFYEKGPKNMLGYLARYLDRLVELKHLQIADTELAASQLMDLFSAGLYRPRLFGVLREEEISDCIEYNVINAVDFFFRGYAVK